MLVKAITYLIWAFLTSSRSERNCYMVQFVVFLPEAGGLYFRRYQNFITSVIGIIITIISPTSKPRTMNSIDWVACDLVGVLWRQAKRFLIGLFRLPFPPFELINEDKGRIKIGRCFYEGQYYGDQRSETSSPFVLFFKTKSVLPLKKEQYISICSLEPSGHQKWHERWLLLL